MRRCLLFLLILVTLQLGGCTSYTRQRGLSFAQLPYPVETKTLEVDGLKLAYTDLGQGPRTLVLIHGLGSYMSFWAKNFETLSKQYRVVALDLPGYGRSSKANYRYSMAFFAKAVNALIDGLRLEHVTLIGHSMGGQIAMTHALLFPGKAEALVLVAPAGLERFRPGETAWMADAVTAKFLMAKDAEAVYTGVAGNFYAMSADAKFLVEDRLKIIEGPEYADYCYANSRSVAAMVEGPVLDRLGQIKVPVLLVFGEHDGLIPNPALHGGQTRAIAEAGAKAIPGAKLVMVPKAGHLVQFEKPDEVHRAMLEFLQASAAPPVSSTTSPAP